MWRVGWLGLFLLAGIARAEQPLPVYPGTKMVRVGNDLTIDGELYRIAYFTTKDSPRKVGRYFYERWTAGGYPVTVDGGFRKEGIVSAFFTREGLIRSVIVAAHGDHTIGFAVLKDVWSAPDAPSPTAFVHIEGTLYSQEVSSRHGSLRERSFLVDRGLGGVRADFVSQLEKQGFALLEERKATSKGHEVKHLTFASPHRRVRVALVGIDHDMTVVSESWRLPKNAKAAPGSGTGASK